MVVTKIPGVSLAVFWEDRCLDPEEDGFLGELAAGSVEIRATVAPGSLVYGLRRWGDDSYDLQKDQAMLLGLDGGSKVYRARMGLEANWETCEPFVPYPNNLLLLAELVTEGGRLTNRVRIWRTAVVSQEGRFFLTAQIGYETTAHQDRMGRTVFPRFQAHPQLEAILVRLRPNAERTIVFPRSPLPGEKGPRRELVRTDSVPEVAELPPIADFVSESEPILMDLRQREAYVLRFYDARGIGTVLTPHGVARVNWRECPARPRRRHLVASERVRYERLGAPVTHRPHLRFEGDRPRPGRSTKFRRQAFGLTLCA